MNFKLLADQGRQIHAAHKSIAAGSGRLRKGQIQFVTQGIEYFHGKEGDLALVVLPEIEKAITANAATGDTGDFFDSNHRILTSRLAMMAEEIVTSRNEKVFDTEFDRVLHFGNS